MDMQGGETEVSERAAGNRRDGVLEAQINALKDEMHTRFESMESLLTQRIRHGDDNQKVVMEMLMNTVKDIQKTQHVHDEWAKAQMERFDARMDATKETNELRFRAIEDRQLSWTSSVKMIGGMVGFASAIGGIAGTILGLTLG